MLLTLYLRHSWQDFILRGMIRELPAGDEQTLEDRLSQHSPQTQLTTFYSSQFHIFEKS